MTEHTITVVFSTDDAEATARIQDQVRELIANAAPSVEVQSAHIQEGDTITDLLTPVDDDSTAQEEQTAQTAEGETFQTPQAMAAEPMSDTAGSRGPGDPYDSIPTGNEF